MQAGSIVEQIVHRQLLTSLGSMLKYQKDIVLQVRQLKTVWSLNADPFSLSVAEAP